MQRKTLYISVVGLVMVSVVGTAFYLNQQNVQLPFLPDQEKNSTIRALSQEKVIVKEKLLAPIPRSTLNGVVIAKSKSTQPVLAVVVENSPQARPQSGLQNADIVFETLAEGGITRFMALYQSQNAESVGPVRSARTYFAEIAKEYDAWFAHSGGSEDGIRFIAQNKIKDLDEFFHETLYFRDNAMARSRGREHSLYTKTDFLRSYVNKQNNQEFSLDPWEFKKLSEIDQFEKIPSAEKVFIDFSYPQFQVEWHYDAEMNSYKRFMAEKPHIDYVTGQQIIAKNVLIQYVKMAAATNYQKNDASAVSLQLKGEGKGVLLRDGKAISLTWKKDDLEKRTKFYMEDGQKVPFNPGLVWIELIDEKSVDYK